MDVKDISTNTRVLIALLLVGCADALSGDVIDLVYDPIDGNVQLDTNGLSMVSFALQNEPGNDEFNIANTTFLDLPTALFTDNTPTVIGWASQDLATGFVGIADLGNIFPLGLSKSTVEDFTNLSGTIPPEGRTYGLAPVPPGGGGQMNVVLVDVFTPGDANFDGMVDEVDFNIWQANSFTESMAWGDGDFNQDGFVDVSDFNIWNDNRSLFAPVPEPTCGGLLLGVLLLFIRGRLWR